MLHYLNFEQKLELGAGASVSYLVGESHPQKQIIKVQHMNGCPKEYCPDGRLRSSEQWRVMQAAARVQGVFWACVCNDPCHCYNCRYLATWLQCYQMHSNTVPMVPVCWLSFLPCQA